MWLTGSDGQQRAPNSSGMETGGVVIQALAGRRAARMAIGEKSGCVNMPCALLRRPRLKLLDQRRRLTPQPNMEVKRGPTSQTLCVSHQTSAQTHLLRQFWQ